MERLKSVCLLALIAIAAPLADAEQTGRQSGSYAVIGDVEKCGNYTIPDDSIISVEQAARKAAPLSKSVQINVIRADQNRVQWTQVLTSTSTDNGELVQDGDVLVVQSLSPLTGELPANAALRTDSSVLILALTHDGIAIGDVLQQTNNFPAQDGQLRVISRFEGRKPIDRAELHLPVAHGDVISISRNNNTRLKGYGNMAPSFSEWKGVSAPIKRDPFMPNHNDPATDADSAFPLNPQTFQFPPFPTTDEPEVDADTAELEPGPNSTSDSPPSESVAASAISQSGDIADRPQHENKISFASDSTTIAPAPPLEVPIDGDTTASSAVNPWNLVFIGGLLLAGTLILAGTMKPDTTDETFAAKAIVPQRIVSASPLTSPPTIATVPVATTPAYGETAIQPSRTVAKSQPLEANSNVGASEWFSNDWQKQSTESGISTASDIANEIVAVDKDCIADQVEVPEKLIDTKTNTMAVNQTAASPEIEDTMTMKSAFTTAKEQKDVSPAVPEQVFSDLEDLLQNRLPIDLCQAKFPLRVSLFGKPIGPQRLRIDASHDKVPAPHINLTAEKRREIPVAAAAAPQPSQAPPASDAAGSLDRALHFLQERTNS